MYLYCVYSYTAEQLLSLGIYYSVGIIIVFAVIAHCVHSKRQHSNPATFIVFICIHFEVQTSPSPLTLKNGARYNRSRPGNGDESLRCFNGDIVHNVSLFVQCFDPSCPRVSAEHALSHLSHEVQGSQETGL